jgi:hypothetical protein
MAEEAQPLVLRERITLKKYAGDPPAPGQVKVPEEIIIIEDGQVVARLVPQKEA